MIADGRSADTTALVRLGSSGLSTFLDRVLPEIRATTATEAASASQAIERLGSFWPFRRNRKEIGDAYRRIFEDKDPVWLLDEDHDWMMLSAFVAARDFGIEGAKKYLLRRIADPDKCLAMRDRIMYVLDFVEKTPDEYFRW